MFRKYFSYFDEDSMGNLLEGIPILRLNFPSGLHTGEQIRSSTLTKSRSQLMVERLRDLQASSLDIEASAIVSVDGLSIASALPQEVEEDRVSAMSAAMLSLGERIASELGRGVLDQVYIKGENGYVILMSVGEEAVLTVLAREQAKLGLILYDMRRATEALEKLI